MTGLSVKALRHYDDTGLLRPAEVDPVSRYRRYGVDQVRPGVVVRALRDAGVPLREVAQALEGDPADVLARHRDRVLREREREDRAHDTARRVLATLTAPVDVVERTVPALPYAGRVLVVDADPDDAADVRETDAEANALLGDLAAALQEEGAGPVGPFWTTMRPGPRPEQVELVLCWPTVRPLPRGWGGDDVETGELPARRELAVRLPAADVDDVPPGVVHPAALALFDAAAARDVEPLEGSLRQTVVVADGDVPRVELSMTVA
ncbi:DNA-binding transcriptional MerR regulator [Isoptericola variabilis J7]|nr:DNA-binding transcriptional MerR regulator [Isoptericola variabilis J7]